ERIGRRDLSEVVRVVDHRREEIDGLDQRFAPAEGENARVIEGGLIDEHPPVAPRLLQTTESRAQVPRTHLAGSTGAAHQLGELNLDAPPLGQNSRPMATASISTRAPL